MLLYTAAVVLTVSSVYCIHSLFCIYFVCVNNIPSEVKINHKMDHFVVKGKVIPIEVRGGP
jgi:hypothetical protein